MHRSLPRRRLILRHDTIRALTPIALRDARSGLQVQDTPLTPECPSDPTYCAKYCSD